MPADTGAGPVLDHQHLLKLGGGQPGKCAGPLPKRQQKGRYVAGLLKRSLIEVVTPAERNGAPLSDKALKLEFFERQCSHLLQQSYLLFRRHHVRQVPEPLRPGFALAEEGELLPGHGSAAKGPGHQNSAGPVDSCYVLGKGPSSDFYYSSR